MVVTPVLEVGDEIGMLVTWALGNEVTLLGTTTRLVSVQGTSVVYVLVTMTGAGEDTLMVQGQARRWSVSRWPLMRRTETEQLTQGDGGLGGDGVGSVQVGPGGGTRAVDGVGCCRLSALV